MIYNFVLILFFFVVVLFWGLWIDNGGRRKFVLFVVILGVCLEMVIILLVMYFDWLVYVLIVGVVLNGLLGFVIVLFVGVMVYIVDVFSKEERVF